MSSPTEPLRNLKGQIEGSYPFAISQVYHRCQMTKKEDPVGKYKAMTELFECFLQFVSAVALLDAKSSIPHLKDRLPQKDKSLDFLRRPSMGHWVGILRDIISLPEAKDQGVFLPDIHAWLKEPSGGRASELLVTLHSALDVQVQTSSKVPVMELLNVFVTLRNKRIAHGSLPLEEQLSMFSSAIEQAIAYLLSSAEFLSSCRLYFVEERTLGEQDEWLIGVQELNGLGEERLRLVHDHKLDAKELYLAKRGENRFGSTPLKLSPFLLWNRNEDSKQHEIYFYNAALKTKLEYHAFSSGSFYFHKELHQDLKSLIQLELAPSETDPAIEALSREERSLKADEYFKRASIFLQRNRYEDALELIETAMEYERRAAFFILKATAEEQLHESFSLISQTLGTALEIDPDNQQAVEYHSRIQQKLLEDAEGNRQNVQPIEEDPECLLEGPTLFQALTPRRIRHYSLLWWLGIVFSWYGLSMIGEYLHGSPGKDFIGMVGIIIASTVFAIGLPSVRIVTLALKLPLSLQLDHMRLSRFTEEWYPDRLQELFGRLIFEPVRHHGQGYHDRFNLRETLKAEPKYLSVSLLFFFIIWSLILLASGSLSLSAPMIFKRMIDYGLLVFMLIPCIRFILMSTKFVLDYSQLSIKPMLTRINDDGLRSFGPFLNYNIFLATSANTGFFICASFMNTGPIWGDLPVLAIISLIVMCWSIGMPYTIYRAARAAKFNAIHTYAEHIEDAFRAFLKQPGEETLKKYQWLLENQKVIMRISNWPLSIKNTLVFVAGSNLLLLGVNIWFIYKRTGNEDVIIQFVTGLWPF